MNLLRDLRYDKNNGTFTWTAAGRKRRVGGRAGSAAKNGYRSIRIDGILYYEHRLAWLAIYGEFPQEEIDHIDGNPSNNSINNLRAASRIENTWNVKRHCDNKSGLKGTCFDHRRKKWFARIQGKWLGYFSTKEAAYTAYCRAAIKQYGQFHNLGEST